MYLLSIHFDENWHFLQLYGAITVGMVRLTRVLRMVYQILKDTLKFNFGGEGYVENFIGCTCF